MLVLASLLDLDHVVIRDVWDLFLNNLLSSLCFLLLGRQETASSISANPISREARCLNVKTDLLPH